MKKIKLLVVAIIFVSAVFACKKKESKTQLEFTIVSVSDSTQNYVDDTTLNNVIKISYIKASDKGVATSLADSINKDFFAWLSVYLYTDNNQIITKENLKDVVSAEIERFITEIKEDESVIDYEPYRYAELSIEPKEPFQNDKIISIIYNAYQYSGGAHETWGLTAFNYNKKDGSVIDIYNLSTNIDELTTIAEKAFIEQNGSLEEFWFEDDRFTLPNTFYFEDGKIIFYYHLYEISSYAAGDFTIELKNDDVKHIINYIQ